jgi:hypothetical protein
MRHANISTTMNVYGELHGSEEQSQYIGGAAGAVSRPNQIGKGRQLNGLSYGASNLNGPSNTRTSWRRT